MLPIEREMIRYRKYMALIRCLILCFTVAVPMAGLANNAPGNLPAGFRPIGNYQLKSKVKVENGVSTSVVISPLRYRVYSDGIDVRVYCSSSGEDHFTSYRIYRSDGIGVAKRSGGIEVVAGVQAVCEEGNMTRQLSVTRNSLTMVKMPPRSNRVLVTRAVSITESQSASSADKKTNP